MNYRELSWQGQHMVSGGDYRYTWVDTPNPGGGETVSMGTLGMMPAENGATVTHYEVPCTVWGDYCGDSCQRSNYRSLLRDYPETFVEVRGDFYSQYLAIRVEDLTEDLDELFTNLVEQYPLYDDEDHSQLEWDEANEQWGDWGRADVLRSLERDYGVDTDGMNMEDLDIRFWQYMSEASEYPYLEDATTIVFPGLDGFVAMVAQSRKAT